MLSGQNNWFAELLADRQGPCISIYQPVHRARPLAEEGPILFGNLLRQAERDLQKTYDEAEIRPLIDKLKGAAADPEFWQGPRDGIALFAAPDYLQVIELQRSVEPLAIVADSFHIKPLIRVMQFADRFLVLTVTQRDVRLYEGTQYRLTEIPGINLPNTQIKAGGRQVTGPSPASTSRNMNAGGPGTEETSLLLTPHHLQPEAFLQAIDRIVWENHARYLRLPMILVAPVDYHALFRKITQNPDLMDEGIMLNPAGLDLQRLHAEAWKIMQPRVQRQVEQIKDRFAVARAHALGSDDVQRIAEKAAAGAIDTLILESERQIAGKFDERTGELIQSPLGDPRTDDLLDDIAELTLKRDGDVLVIPPEQMPTNTGAAAIFRF